MELFPKTRLFTKSFPGYFPTLNNFPGINYLFSRLCSGAYHLSPDWLIDWLIDQQQIAARLDDYNIT